MIIDFCKQYFFFKFHGQRQTSECHFVKINIVEFENHCCDDQLTQREEIYGFKVKFIFIIFIIVNIDLL